MRGGDVYTVNYRKLEMKINIMEKIQKMKLNKNNVKIEKKMQFLQQFTARAFLNI